ncbi:hypothetical protein Rs2_12256 [Raphanus sativus]|uniref:Uncharacterized protein LOC108845650 n=1 Tax=Raphanus sativus TaxID=3726 RepID=A0A6J0MPC4_RAPSA|nr:uncharacterized protein LOC108845650 [Raphanus sativus]XP_056862471.1 uncharacterized protein LOC130510141 [Raphanus sativus]KAJ4866543.1 hypothetical protein Rs2_51936 [Raphanus sativus]KAJ4908598.1 hypothetical protein Rs2_12256 [Raphanus sativus]
MYQESLQIYHMWRLAVQERDEAREHLKHSLAELSQLRELYDAVLLTEQQMITYYPEAIDVTTCHQKCNYDHFPGDYPSRFLSPSPSDPVSNLSVDSSPLDLSVPANQSRSVVAENMRDYETIVLETIGGTLPEYGKFLQAVSEAGSLVESLLVTGPVPKWRNPPVLLSGNNITGNWSYGGLEYGSRIQNRSFSGKMSNFSLMS